MDDLLAKSFESHLPGAALEVSRFGKSRRWTSFWVEQSQAEDAAKLLHAEGWTTLENFSVFHWNGSSVMNYFLVNPVTTDTMVFRFSVPSESDLPSMSRVWPSAGVQEKESGAFG